MTRRALLISLALSLAGTRGMERHNKLCHNMGKLRERGGLTDRERAQLERRGCRKDSILGWVSGLFWEA